MSDAQAENHEMLAGRRIGQAWLRAFFDVRVPAPCTESYVVAGARRTETSGDRTTEFYPRSYATGDDPVANLRFALRYEPLDLRVLVGAMAAMGPETIEAWVRAEPTGAYARRAWFFYEHFLGCRLDLPDATAGNYVFALDEDKHITGARRNSPRQRVADNLLGTPAFCPIVRRTSRLAERMALRIDEEARELVASYDPALLARAVSYLYTKETRSSFAIEGESPSPQRAERFVAALRRGASFDAGSKAAIVDLQNAIVDPRYAARDWRDFQNFVGSMTVDFREDVHFICPRPQDVPLLMGGWMEAARRVMGPGVDPVVAAAVTAFAFVFIHPFEDGNGRIHRFLIHHVLSRTGFTPGGVIFPVSAAIVRDQRGYDEVLESFSQPLLAFTDWGWTAEREIIVRNDTASLFRYFDATRFAEYLYDRVIDTVRIDLKEELGFLAVFDRALEAVRDIVDMPDRRASLLIRLMLQNGGRLSQAKRRQFDELSDAEIAAMEIALQRARTASED
ncbi:Fic family protein [Xanthobacter aminoxidans]|uniref:Fic family protein n=1 Tax=Xanthobacter aminoxidans TaxID=186280 RepID=UPI0020230080|nr:Fic family protein [Xanthobacter aminoxidans]MCL8380865.1 Fic family protein [Xanthobacter aminoxidans]